MSWGKKTIAGVDYDLTHLDSFEIEVTPQQQQTVYKVRVVFGAHTFARDLLPSDTPDFHVQDGYNTRCFCPQRYGHSIHLPDIVKRASNGKAYFGNKDARYLLIENLPGLNAPYLVPFKVDKPDTPNVDATMFVVSRHPRPGLQRMPAIRLATLIHLTVEGKPVVRPKGR